MGGRGGDAVHLFSFVQENNLAQRGDLLRHISLKADFEGIFQRTATRGIANKDGWICKESINICIQCVNASNSNGTICLTAILCLCA